ERGGQNGEDGGVTCLHCFSIHRPAIPPNVGGGDRGRVYGSGAYGSFLRWMLPESVCTLILAPPPPVLKLSSFSVVHRLWRVGAGPKSFSMLPLKLETEKSAPRLAGRTSSTEPLTVSAS